MIEISRTATIDLGHRVTNHASKCKNVHGHTFRIELFATGPLVSEGSSEGMVVDYGYLKTLLEKIDALFDHGFAMWQNDKDLVALHFPDWVKLDPLAMCAYFNQKPFGKVIITREVPTSENLAYMWLNICRWTLEEDKLKGLVHKGLFLTRIKVWETPNSQCEVSA